MIRQQPEGHDTFPSGDSCFCVAKVAPVALSTITASVNRLSDKRYLCVRINHQLGPLSRTEQKSLLPQAVSGEQNHRKITMIRQQPGRHDTFASGDSCFCVAKVAPVALSIVTVSVNWLSDKRYLCARINHQIGPLSRTEQKSL